VRRVGGQIASIAFSLFIAIALPSVGAAASDLAGHPSVIDGDTIDLHGTRIRFFGIDAPESRQLCKDENGKDYRCGQKAAFALADHIGPGTVSCDPRDIDRYGRTVAVCHLGSEDLNAWLVSQGWAVAYRHYSRDYVPQEEAAHAAKLGIWVGSFMMPWKWRAAERSKTTSSNEYTPIPLLVSCCKVCSAGKACGDSCISKSKQCHKGPGCACDGG
jgi:endonuclease YncB( thermonuclease family)